MNDNADHKEYIQDAIELANSIVEWASCDYMDDTSGNGKKICELFEQWVDGEIMEERPAGVHITGPDGCGKHTALLYLLKSIKEISKYDFIYFDKYQEINESLLIEISNELIKTYAKEKPLCMIIDGYECGNDYYRFLYRELYKRWLNKNTEIFIILIDSGNELPSFLSDIMYTLRISKPTYRIREKLIDEYFDTELDISSKLLFDDIYGLNSLIEDTEGLTYKEIRKILDVLKDYILENKDLEEETKAKEINDIMDGYRPVKSETVVDRILPRIDALIDAIAKISINTRQGNTNVQTVNNTYKTQPDINKIEEYGQQIRDKYNNMPVKQLVKELLDKANSVSSIEEESIDN